MLRKARQGLVKFNENEKREQVAQGARYKTNEENIANIAPLKLVYHMGRN